MCSFLRAAFTASMTFLAVIAVSCGGSGPAVKSAPTITVGATELGAI